MKRLQKVFKITLIFIVFLVIFFVGGFFILNIIYPLDTSKIFYQSQSKLVYDKDGNVVFMALNDDDFWIFKSDYVPKILKDSVIAFEDKYFYYHFGINPFSMIRASLYNLTHKNRIGASTLSMQVARMLEPKERNYKSKFIEVFRALQLELNYSKDEILNIYFNIAPYGGNIYGVRAASYFYFQKDLKDLSIAQMAILATIPKNPNQNKPYKQKDLNKVKKRVLNELYKNGTIDESKYKRALEERLVSIKADSIKKAYHYSNLAIKNGASKTNLDLALQEHISQRAKVLSKELAVYDANNISVIVVDNDKMSVIAYLGSHDLKAKNGYVDGVLAKHSTGSSLKPFIYAKAFDMGLITPKQKLIDTNIYLSGYSPRNYYNEFIGRVGADDSLNFSLNTTAVFLNNKLGLNSLYEMLKSVDLVDEKKEYYGDAIALGGAELSVLDLAHIYTAFANDGKVLPLEFAGNVIDKKMELFSPQAAYLTTRILEDGLRSYLNAFWQNAENTPEIAFKTGTSAKAKDLYAVGYNKDYTVVVWIGNFNGMQTKDLTGAKSSLKLVFEIFKYLDKTKKLNAFKIPLKIIQKEICIDEFLYENCKNYVKDYVIDGVDLVDKCGLLNHEQINYLLLNGFATLDEIKKSPCVDFLKLQKPLLASPSNGADFILNLDEKTSKIMIKCLSFLDENVYIKIDENDYFKIKSNDEFVFEFDKGFHTIKCLDENSNLSSVEFEVREMR